MGIREKMLGENAEMIDTAVRICRGYLSGPWKKITSKDVTVKRVSGGLSNWLYRVKLEKEVECGGGVPRQVLVRVYGQSHGEAALESLVTESVIFTLLSERRLGPRLHGVFPGGRIEEYIPARPLTLKEMADPSISGLVADKMAAIHKMNVPINKEPRWLWDTIDRWLTNLEENCNPQQVTLKQEAHWLRDHLGKLGSSVVFCHNDLQEGNILLREDSKLPPSLVIIDFEYCSYNYRGFDLANHFVEWVYDYTRADYPHFTASPQNYPTKQQMEYFAERYLGEKDSASTKGLLVEVAHFTLASHFFWALWSLVNANHSQIPFGYKEYAEERLGCYFALKKALLSLPTTALPLPGYPRP